VGGDKKCSKEREWKDKKGSEEREWKDKKGSEERGGGGGAGRDKKIKERPGEGEACFHSHTFPYFPSPCLPPCSISPLLASHHALSPLSLPPHSLFSLFLPPSTSHLLSPSLSNRSGEESEEGGGQWKKNKEEYLKGDTNIHYIVSKSYVIQIECSRKVNFTVSFQYC